MTIRARLALTYGVAVAATIAVVGVVVWWQFGIALRSALGQRLETRVAAVETSLENSEQAGLQESDDEQDLFVALVAGDGTIVDASAGAPTQLLATVPAGPAREVSVDSGRFLVMVDQSAEGLRIVVGANLASLERSQASLARLLGVAGGLAALLSAAGGWWLAGRALRPVSEITAEAAAIGASDLDRRLPEPPRADELGVLARALNAMLDRIRDAMERQRSFVAAASHDLRTPLAALQTELELVDRPDADRDELRAAVRAARDDAARLAELADDLLQLASVASSGRQLLRIEVELPELVDSVIRRVAPIADRSEVRLSNRVSRGVVDVDRVRLEQALANLLVNAVTYSPSGGAVEISGGREPDADTSAFVIGVLDRGPGVPDAEREAIFEPFRRGRAAPGSGAGLGLATARAAVEAHGGTLSAEPREGGGAAFWIRVPADLSRPRGGRRGSHPAGRAAHRARS